MENASPSEYRFKRFVRDLLPHAAWRGIEWLIDLAGASLIAAAAAYQWFSANLGIISVLIVFLVSLAILAFTPLGSAIFGGAADWIVRRLLHPSPPIALVSTYLEAFLARTRFPLWDPHLESNTVIETARFPIADVPFELNSSPLDQSIVLDNVGRTRTVGVPQFVEQVLLSSGLGVRPRRRYDKQAQVFVFLGAPACGKSSLMIQIAKWVASKGESDSRYPIPVYVNLTHFGDDFPVGVNGLTRLVRMSIRQACPRYLSTRSRVSTPVGEETARTLSASDSSIRVLYILDGLDEVPAEGRFAEQHKERIASIAAFIEDRPQQVFLVTCRQEDYVALRSYRNNFAMSVYVIRPWSRRLFRLYVNARTASVNQTRRSIRRLIVTADDSQTWGPLSNTPLLGAMLLKWPSSKGMPTAGELWEHFIYLRLRPCVGSDEAYKECIHSLERLGMALTVRPDRPLRLGYGHLDAAQRAGLLADAPGIAAQAEFAIKPLQQYFAARYMLGEIRQGSTDTFELTHQRLRYAARLLIEIGKEDPRLLQHLAGYLTSSGDVHEAARRFETCARWLSAKQLEASEELEDALIAIVDHVLREGDAGDLFFLFEGIKSLPVLLSRRRQRAVLLLRGLTALGAAPIRRRLLQLCVRSPIVFLMNPRPILTLFASLINTGTLSAELSAMFGTLPASHQTVRTTARVLSGAIPFVSKFVLGSYLYGTYLCGVMVANRLALYTASLFGVGWPYDQTVPGIPHDLGDVVIRVVFLGTTTVLPWLLVTRSARAGFRHLSVVSRVVTVVLASGFLRYLFLLPVLGMLVVTTIPSGLEFVVILGLFIAPLAVIARAAWLGSGDGIRQKGIPTHEVFALLGVVGSTETGPYAPGLTRSPVVAWYSRLLALAQAARRSITDPGHRIALTSGAVVMLLVVSLPWIHRLAWFGCFLLGLTGVAIYFERRFFRYYRECVRTLAGIRAQLADLMRRDYDATLTLLLGEILDQRKPLFVRKKYLQFIASDVPWDRDLIARFRQLLDGDRVTPTQNGGNDGERAQVPDDIKTYLEILVATKVAEAEMHESPGLDSAQLSRLFEEEH